MPFIDHPVQLHPEQAVVAYYPDVRAGRDDDNNANVLTHTAGLDGRTTRSNDRANQLALRFAFMLGRRQRARGLLLNDISDRDTGAASITTRSRATTRKNKRSTLSKSCATQRRRRDEHARQSRLGRPRSASRDATASVLAQATACARDVVVAEERERELLEATIRELRTSIAHLEQSQLLSDSARVTYRLNQTGVAVDVCRQYYVHFAYGYDGQSTLPAVAARSAATRAFMASVAEPDLLTRDFRGADAFLHQWQLYTTCYDDYSVQMCSLRVVDDDDRYISISTAAEMRFVFCAKSIEMLFPHLHAQLATSAAARAIAAKLYGRECRLAFDLVLHFNQRGKFFVTESRVHLASALLELIVDPFAAMSVLNASVITEDGHWQTADSTDVREKSHALPKTFLWRE